MSSTTSELTTTDFVLQTKIFKAGAGAGKTTRLVKEVYDFYNYFKAEHGRNPKVVLTTFTRKATQELRERLMHEAQKRRDHDFLNFVLSKNNLFISTIHGTLQLFLKQYAQKINLDPGFQLVEDKELFKRAKIILKGILSKNIGSHELLEEFTFKNLTLLLVTHDKNKRIYRDVTYFDKNDFLKTQEILVKNISEKFLSFSGLILSQTENVNWIDYAKYLKTVGETFSSCEFENETYLNIQKGFNLYHEYKKPIFIKKKPPFSEELNEAFEEFREDLKKLNIAQFDPNKWTEMIKLCKIFHEISEEFSAKFDDWKKSSGQISMADLELYSYELVKSHPYDIHFFSENFDYWLIDEFQDTSPLQVELLKELIKDRRYFVVGDPQQSIYFFRGARVQVFEEMQKNVIKQKGVFASLNKNYRSNQNTMGFINYFFENYSEKFQSMEIGGNPSTREEVATIAISDDVETQNLAILNYIQSLYSQGVELSEICILARKNDQLTKIAEILKKKKIPYILHSASGFQERREILDALAILKFLVNPHDNFNLVQVLRSPWFKVLDHHIYEVTKTKPASFWLDFQDHAQNIQNTDQKFEAINRLKKYIGETYTSGITQTFQKILMETGFFELSYHCDSSGRRESNLWKLLVQIKTEDHKPGFNYIDFIENRRGSMDLEGGSEDSDAVSSIEPNRVQLMTVHMSKGLEFKHVIIPFFDVRPNLTNYLPYIYDITSNKFSLHLKLNEEKGQQALPAAKLLEKVREEELLESDRLLYVAMTRAKESLFLSTSSTKQNKGSWFGKVKIDISEGIHRKGNFLYHVKLNQVEDTDFSWTSACTDEISNKLFDLESLKKKESSKVTNQVEKVLVDRSQESLIALLEKANHGKLAHQIFESLKYNKEISTDENIKKAIEYIKNLTEIPMMSILKNGYAEWGFVINDGGQNLSGQIDLWAHIKGELWIIDYKTGSSFYSNAAFEQLALYAKALQNYVQANKVNLIALYPFEQKFLLKEMI